MCLDLDRNRNQNLVQALQEVVKRVIKIILQK